MNPADEEVIRTAIDLLASTSALPTNTKSPYQGKVIGFKESREVLYVKDTLGNVAEMIPLEPVRACIQISLELKSKRTVEFWVDLPKEVLPFLEENVQTPQEP